MMSAERLALIALSEEICCRTFDSANWLEIGRDKRSVSTGLFIGEGQGFESPQLHPPKPPDQAQHGRTGGVPSLSFAATFPIWPHEHCPSRIEHRVQPLKGRRVRARPEEVQ